MRHLKAGRKLGRNAAHRQAMFRNMVTSLIMEGRVTTTDAKAKELRRWADRIITLGKQSTIAARRRARRFVRTDVALARLFNEVAPRFAERPGGYTRIIKIARRRGDCAPIAVVEFTENVEKAPPAARRGKSARGRNKKSAAEAGGGKAKARKSAD